jgi:hypothetical protein
VDDRGSVPGRGGDFSLCHYVQTGSEAHPASCPVATGGSFPSLRRPEREADHSPLYRAEVKNVWSYTSTPTYDFMAWCLVQHKNSFTFVTAITKSMEQSP